MKEPVKPGRTKTLPEPPPVEIVAGRIVRDGVDVTPVTSSWFTRLPLTHARIGISRGAPRGQSGFMRYASLNPGSWFHSVDAARYVELYGEQLKQLDPMRVVAELVHMSEGRVPALLCFESPKEDADWCHRGMVAKWLRETIQLDVFEFGLERAGCGDAHPKLPKQFRREIIPDLTSDIQPFLGTTFERQGKVYKVLAVGERTDHMLVQSGDEKPIEVSFETMRKYLKGQTTLL